MWEVREEGGNEGKGVELAKGVDLFKKGYDLSEKAL